MKDPDLYTHRLSLLLPICEYRHCFQFADRVITSDDGHGRNGNLAYLHLSCEEHKAANDAKPTGITITLPPPPWPFWINKRQCWN